MSTGLSYKTIIEKTKNLKPFNLSQDILAINYILGICFYKLIHKMSNGLTYKTIIGKPESLKPFKDFRFQKIK